MRLGKTQKLILRYMLREGGEHVFVGVTCTRGHDRGHDLFGGCFWEEVERSLMALVKRGIVIETDIEGDQCGRFARVLD